MNRGANFESIPTDLIVEIFWRLPAKSISRFRCVSKLWGSMFRLPYFTELFLTRSLARPRLLFAVEQKGNWFFFSSHQPQNLYDDKSSLGVAANFHMKFFGENTGCYVSPGLIYFPNMWTSKESLPMMICNPITGKYAILPKLKKMGDINWRNYFGFDPIDKQYKVLNINITDHDETVHHILTLGSTGKMRWRKIQCPSTLDFFREGICINGVLYYLALKFDETRCYRLVCFDVRSEKFKFVDAEWSSFWSSNTLINCKGKIGVITWDEYHEPYFIEFSMWVLEDVEKHEWSKHVYTLPDVIDFIRFSLAGVTSRGTLQSVEIRGLGGHREAFEAGRRVHTFVDYVEDLSVNDAKQLKSSIFAPSMKNKRCLSNTKRPKTQRRGEVRERDRDKKYDDGVTKEKIQRERRSTERDNREDERKKKKKKKKRQSLE